MHLLHHDSVVALKGHVDVHVCLHGPYLIGSQEALAPAALPAPLQNLHTAPGGRSLEPAGQHMNGFPIFGVAFGCQVLWHHHACHEVSEVGGWLSHLWDHPRLAMFCGAIAHVKRPRGVLGGGAGEGGGGGQ